MTNYDYAQGCLNDPCADCGWNVCKCYMPEDEKRDANIVVCECGWEKYDDERGCRWCAVGAVKRELVVGLGDEDEDEGRGYVDFIFRVKRQRVAGETVEVLLEPFSSGSAVSIHTGDEFIAGCLAANPYKYEPEDLAAAADGDGLVQFISAEDVEQMNGSIELEEDD